MNNLLDQAQTIAACVKYVDKRLGELEARISSHISSIPTPEPSEEIDVSSLRESLTESVLSKVKFPEFELPDSVVFEVHLEEAVEDVNKQISAVNEDLSNLIAERVSSTSSFLLGQLDQQGANSNSSIRFVLDALDSATADINSSIEQAIERLRASDRALEHMIELNDAEAVKREQSIDQQSAERDETLAEGIDAVRDNIKGLSESLKPKFEHISQQISLIEDSIAKANTAQSQDREFSEKTQKDLSSFKISHAQDIKIVQEGFKRVDDRLSSLDDKKSDVGHEHPYAEIEHEHPHLASKEEVSRVRTSIGQQGNALSLIANEIQQFKNDLNKKANKTDVLTDDDLEGLAKRIHDSVLLAIPTPADGKDALEWEFKFHETQRGLLMYKREDWKHWRTQNLLGPTQQIQHQQTPIAMGGGPVTVSQNGGGITSYYNGVEIEDRSDFFYTATTDQDGYFELNTDIFENISQVFHVEGHTRMIPDPGLTPDQRIVEVFIDEILPNGTIKGYAFNIRNSRSLIGTQDKTVTPPPSGTQVQIKITGA